MKHVKIEKDVEFCTDCPYSILTTTRHQWDSDSYHYSCRLAGKAITKNGWDYSKVKIPKWCPL